MFVSGSQKLVGEIPYVNSMVMGIVGAVFSAASTAGIPAIVGALIFKMFKIRI